MIRSMTGYGMGKSEADGREYVIEIKTINHRYNDISVRLPRYLSSLEDRIRQYVSKNILRGKTEISITVNYLSNSCRNVNIDRELFGAYVSEMRDLIKLYNLNEEIHATSVLRLPDVSTTNNNEDGETYWEVIKKALDNAISNIISAKEQEGEKLKLDIINRIGIIAGYVDIVSDKSKDLLEEYKTKLKNRINELGANDIIDENRIGMEIVLFADKSSICEEVTRLRSHIDALKEMLNTTGPIGKKLDFLIQEMNRETNTIGSKANSVGITNYVVEMKNEIENIREQVQNIE